MRVINVAIHHVEAGRRIVARQRELIAEGNAAPGAAELLKTFEASLKIFEADLERLLNKRDGK